MRSRRFSFAAGLITAGAFLLLYLPLVLMVIRSFVGPGGGLSLHWYEVAAQNSATLDALRMSGGVALVSTLITVLIGTSAALAIERGRFPGRRFLEVITYFPLVMPEIVMGLSLLVWFVFLKIALGGLSLVLAHVTFSLSYVLITVRARLQGFDRSLEEAARDLGASPWRTFRHVTLPLIFPGMMAGALMAFTLSFDDFLISFFTTSPGSDTLPLKIYAMIKFGISPEIHALSTVLLAVTFGAVLLVTRLSGGFAESK